MLTPSHKEILSTYYKVSDSAYRNWGPDAERPGIYAVHLGYHPEGQIYLDNHSAVRLMTQKVIDAADLKQENRVLDAGCGVGSISFAIADQFPNIRIHAINVVKRQLITADKYSKDRGLAGAVNFSFQDYQSTAFPKSHFDRIIFCESLAHAENKYQLFREARRIGKSGAKLVIADVFSHTADYTPEEKSYFEYLQTGMGVPSIIPFYQIQDWLKELGYTDVSAEDITGNILPSAVLASEHAAKRIREDKIASREITLSRLAMIGSERLLTRGKASYYLLTAFLL